MGQLEQLQTDVDVIKCNQKFIIDLLTEQSKTEAPEVSLRQAANLARQGEGVHYKTMERWIQKGKVNWKWNNTNTRKLVILDEVFKKAG